MNYQTALALRDLPQLKPIKAAIGDTDVMLIREGDNVRAYQATCPHAGAPLENGAVCDGKLVCPWHKAVFDIRNGEMCEPLALRDLKQYPVRIENGQVEVSPKAMSASSAFGQPGESPVWVVMGSGAAGSAAAWTLRREGFRGKLVLIDREPEAPYDRTALTKFVPAGKMAISDVPAILGEDFLPYTQPMHGDVERLDSGEQQLHFADGACLHYDKLLIASGGVPQRPEIEGNALFGVHVLRSIEQADTLLQEVDKTQKLVIIGNSFIGMELASALRNKDIEVQVIARSTLPFKQQFGAEIAHFFRRLHEENGVRFIEGEPAALEGEGQVSGVRLTSGKLIPAEVVLFATGVAPATGFIHDIPLLDDGSLEADTFLQVAENVWAAGDNVTWPGDTQPLRIEHYRVAHQLGRVAAKNMLGKQEPFDRVPFFWTAQFGTRYEYLGHAEEWDAWQLFGSLQDKKFIAVYGYQDKLAAVFTCGLYTLSAELLQRMQQPMDMREAVEWITQRL
ncbi:Rieske 2Fe-2S domain-containing protein [Paramixta manurensis]|uniref:Rieske 2Fe-2S domain-containing protein n=1 Tax=Paramixta manurensis TaxID=2740817 RepID=A0A6M8U633_9GAMM|nr:Rieske 2Fe-2S domain-containing protein [Erwiniaceae bacterium PD-1]